MTPRPVTQTIDQYIASFPEATQDALAQIRRLVTELAPQATECISYAIPTFDLCGTHLVHFAGYPRHIGLYPTGRGLEPFQSEIGGYKTGRGSIQFPLSEPLPLDLIRRIVAHRVVEVTEGRGCA